MRNIKAIEDTKLSNGSDKRYVIVDMNTGEIVDNAQGYGYKSKEKAYAAYNYKNRDKTKDREKLEKRNHIKKWMKEHRDFVHLMDTISFEIAKGSWGSDDKFDAKLVRQLLKDSNLSVDFTAGNLLNVWKNYN